MDELKKLSMFVILRSLSLLAVGFYVFHAFKIAEFNLLLEQKHISFEKYIELRDSVLFYQWFLPIIFLIDTIYNLINRKKRPDGTINMREVLLPEFNHRDEREAELTGKAAKASLAVIPFYTVFVLLSTVLILTSTITGLHYLTFAIITIPIFGLIVYYFSYRYYYAK